MSRSSLFKATSILAAALVVVLAPGSGTASGFASDKPKVIVLGFDGADARLTQRFMDEGKLPNMKRLSEKGTFSPLGTTNPAQSPVSWASMETSTNPGKHNIPDFVRRDNSGPQPFPKPAGVHPLEVPAGEVKDYVPLSRTEELLFQVAGGGGTTLLFVGALVAFVIFFLIAKVVLRLNSVLALILGVVAGGGAGYVGHRAAGELPPRFKVPVGEMEGVRFWDALDENGVRFVGLQVPAAFPCVTQYENARLLSGLFTPDVAGGPGAWFVYTNDEWSQNALATETGGTIYKLYPDKDGVIRTTITGPENFVKRFELEDAIDELEGAVKAASSDAEKADLEDLLNQRRSQLQTFNLYDKKAKVDFHVTPDYAARKATVKIGDETRVVSEGGWTDHARVTFELTKALKVKALCRIYLQECHVDEDENPRLRIFVPPLAISPEDPPPVLPISYPRNYAAQLAEDIGLYDTYGWACYTNALKDQELPEQAFLEGLEYVLKWRTAQLTRELDRDDWDVLFHVESTTDRAGHMLYRFFDPQHPLYDQTDRRTGELLRDKVVQAYGRSFPLSDGIAETYKEMDAIIGDVMTRIEKGDYGDDCTLMVIADHGFQPFRYGVNLNVWLNKMGYLVREGQAVDQTGNVTDFVEGRVGDMLNYIDWSRTKAYSMGLGKIYLNIEGREPKGIVKPADAEALCREIIAKLEEFEDPIRGGRVVKKGYVGTDIYTGPHVDEVGDILVGFNEGYRVSWQTSLGGFEKDTIDTLGILDNTLPWSGDHCGVDPDLVKGIFFTNRKLAPGQSPHVMSIAPTVLRAYGIAQPELWDGSPLSFE